jgi:DNA-binding transcriptional MerR regulator
VVSNMNKNENLSDKKQDENLDKGFTVKEVASFIDETPNVIRNWFKELRQYIPHEKNSNGYNVYKREGVERFKEIQALHRSQNWSMKQIEHYFATGGESFKPEPEKTTGEMLAKELRSLREELAALREENQEIKEQLNKQEGFSRFLVEQLQQLDRGSMERHNQLTQSLKESLVAQKQIAAVKEEQPKKGVFAKLFGK